jgi:hypothetical protein
MPRAVVSALGRRSCADEQTRRLQSRINDPRKIWKLSDMDLKSYRAHHPAAERGLGITRACTAGRRSPERGAGR